MRFRDNRQHMGSFVWAPLLQILLAWVIFLSKALPNSKVEFFNKSKIGFLVTKTMDDGFCCVDWGYDWEGLPSNSIAIIRRGQMWNFSKPLETFYIYTNSVCLMKIHFNPHLVRWYKFIIFTKIDGRNIFYKIIYIYCLINKIT